MGAQRPAWTSVVAAGLAAAALAVATPLVAQARTPIAFQTQDGVVIRGHEFGGGRTVVILSHMYLTDQRVWFRFAEALALRGYAVITYDYRGVGRSGGSFVIAHTYRDALAAVDFANRRGPRPVVLIGASMGGTVSLKAAANRPVRGVVAISSGTRFRGLDVRPHLPSMRVPKLFIVGAHDQPFERSARLMYAASPPPKRLRVYPTHAHGTHLLQTKHGQDIEREIFAFIRQQEE